MKQRHASLFHLVRIAPVIKRDRKKGSEKLFGRDATSVCSVDPPLSDPVKKVSRCGGPVKRRCGRRMNGEEALETLAVPRERRLSVSLSRPLISLWGPSTRGLTVERRI